MRGTALRWIAVIALGVALLAVVLFFASTVDGRPPQVGEMRLTQSLSTDASVALTTTSIEVVFSEEVDHAEAEDAFGIEPDVDGAFSWSGSSLFFTPDAPLPLETEFRVTLASGVADAAGNRMSDPATPFSFRTVGPPRVIGVNPPDGAADVPLEATLRVTFSTLMDTASAEAAISLRPAVELELSWRQEILEVTPVVPLQPDRRYELIVDADATDQTGTPIAERSVTSFTTVASGLSAERIVPADGSEGIAVGTRIRVAFDGEIDPDSLEDASLSITPDVPGTLEVVAPEGAAGMRDDSRHILSFSPSGRLPPTTTFRVEVGAGLRSIDGRILARGLSWSFTTGAPQPTLANQILFLSDRSGVTNLWAMNPDGSNERQLSSEPNPVVAYAAAPDGRSFVVGDGARLVAQEAGGGNRRVLTDADAIEFDPSFAPDGSALVFGRADRATGSGLGIWRREGVTGAAERIDVAPDEAASPTVDPSVAAPVALLRAPRYAPDGGAIAWIDEAGQVVVMELESETYSTASFGALEPPVWLADGAALVVSGSPDAEPPPDRSPNSPVAQLEAGAGTPPLQLVRISRDARSVEPLTFAAGGARVTAGTTGGIAFVVPSAAGRAGTLWVTNRAVTAATRLLSGDDRIARATFAPDPNTLVVERVAADGAPSGLWLLDERSGALTQLSRDGSEPRLLP